MIILEALKFPCPEPPIPSLLSEKGLQNRARLCNHFDADYPLHTCIYIERRRTECAGADALLRTCRRLRHDTLDLLHVTTSREEVTFVLDVLLVKDVGVFPTWMSMPPSLLEHVPRLQINLRIVRPNRRAIPLDWRYLAQNEQEQINIRGHSTPTVWNLYVVLFLHATSRLSSSPDNSVPQMAVRTSGLDVPSSTPLAHAYLAARGRYTIGELRFQVAELEYRASGKPILPYVYVRNRQSASRFYKDEYTPFAQCLLGDYYPPPVAEPPRSVVDARAQGRMVSWVCFSRLSMMIRTQFGWYQVSRRTPSDHNQAAMNHFFDAAAEQIRAMVIYYRDFPDNATFLLGGEQRNAWEWVLGRHFKVGDVTEMLVAEAELDSPDERRLRLLRLIERRMELGWWDQDKYDKLWTHWTGPRRRAI